MENFFGYFLKRNTALLLKIPEDMMFSSQTDPICIKFNFEASFS